MNAPQSSARESSLAIDAYPKVAIPDLERRSDFRRQTKDVESAPRNHETTDSTSNYELSVLQVVNGEHFAGAERVQQHLGQQLPGNRIGCEFACLKSGKFPELAELPGHRIHPVGMKGRFDLRAFKRLMDIVQRGNFDVLHAHTPRAAMLTSQVAKRLDLPWIYHVHSPTSRDSTRWLLNRINQFIENRSVRGCNKFITVSKSLRREILNKGFDRRRVVYIPNGVPEQTAIDWNARKHCASWNFGVIALFRPRKGLEVLIEAMAHSTLSNIDCKLEVVGGFESTAYETQIRSQVSRLGLENRVVFSGFTSRVNERIEHMDALVLPSLFGEGMPMVVLEAMAKGVPVIASRVEGVPDVVRDGVEGYLANPGDPNDLAQRLARVTKSRNTWADLGEHAFDRHRERFSDRTMTRRTARVYRNVLNNHW